MNKSLGIFIYSWPNAKLMHKAKTFMNKDEFLAGF